MLKKFSFIIILVFGLTACSNPAIEQDTDDLDSAQVQVTVSDEATLERTVYFEEGDPLVEVMKDHFQVVTNDKNNQIIAIDQFDTRDEELGAYWIYRVNGSQSRTSPDQYQVQNGDEIEWIYWPMTPAE